MLAERQGLISARMLQKMWDIQNSDFNYHVFHHVRDIAKKSPQQLRPGAWGRELDSDYPVLFFNSLLSLSVCTSQTPGSSPGGVCPPVQRFLRIRRLSLFFCASRFLADSREDTFPRLSSCCPPIRTVYLRTPDGICRYRDSLSQRQRRLKTG